MTDLVAQLVGALEWTIRELDRNTCTHEETHRGGAIWTICDDCGMKWADDRGGFKPYKEPAQLKAARATLSAAKDGGWLPIETAPKDGAEVLVGSTVSPFAFAVASWDGEEWRDIGDIGWAGMTGENNQPTHWQPLPNPPKGEV